MDTYYVNALPTKLIVDLFYSVITVYLDILLLEKKKKRKECERINSEK